MSTKPPRQRLLAQIHIARKQLALDDDTYRQALKTLTGKTSAKHLSLPELRCVMDDFTRKGFVPKKGGKRPRPAKNRTALMNKIEALLADKNQSWQYAHSMAEHMFGLKRVDWLNADQLWRLVAALEIQRRRDTQRQPKQAPQ
ncbi:gp16 family protein [Spongiibacter sp. UBA1325]|uniref:gp16 family protein n=1 Tax=Spongiibacter sp. UBA1325 TaxID=1947543 RepID=UPI00257CDD39|nr:regulatory protein GemA [Spongiibacter sp. UBA1325]|tara:strand:+ start:1218 stop:1646 length:429 start_codon:yes stop_codon:yes gene_type:complete